MPVKITVLNVLKKEEVAYQEGITVRKVLEAKKVDVPQGGTITVDGEEATLDSAVPDNGLVVITPNPSHAKWRMLVHPL